ncbi:MAG: CoA-binding protein [Bacteroidetes bacterium]|nr:CoA-binding protein [Bacteroidota bacterium]
MVVNNDTLIHSILTSSRTIAVVGASENPLRDSGRIYQFLKRVGYKVFPVNPNYTTIFGDHCYPTLRTIPEEIDIVDVFRKPEDVAAIVDDAVASNAKVLWLQLGVINEVEAARAESLGLQVIMNRCIAMEYTRLIQ